MNDLIRELYHFELHRKDGITSRIPFALTLITLLGSLNVYLGKHFPTCNIVLSFILCLLLAIATVALALAIYSFYMCLIGRDYKVLALGSEFLAWHQDVLDYFGPEQNTLAKQHIDRELLKRMAEATDENSMVNNIRTAYLNLVYIRLGITAASILAYGIVYAFVVIF